MELALPNLHPAVIHFPVVLIPLALLVEILAMLRKTDAWHRIAATSWLAAALATTVAFLAGRAAADGLVGVDPRVQPAIGDHADWAAATLALVWFVTVARGLAVFLAKRRRFAVPAYASAIVVAVAAQPVMFLTADKGGALVYRHGLAVMLPECPACELQEPAAPATDVPAHGLSLISDSHRLLWTPRPSDVGALGVSPWPQVGVAIEVDGAEEILLPERMGDAQVTAWLDLTRFDGEVWILHHLDGSSGGALVVSTAGDARLIDLNSTETVLDRATADVARRAAYSVSASGRHLKGMIDGKVVLHGHADANAPGRIGLRLVGQGVVAIEKLEVVRIDEAP